MGLFRKFKKEDKKENIENLHDTESKIDIKTIDDIVNHGVGKCLDQFDIDHDLYPRWGSF